MDVAQLILAAAAVVLLTVLVVGAMRPAPDARLLDMLDRTLGKALAINEMELARARMELDARAQEIALHDARGKFLHHKAADPPPPPERARDERLVTQFADSPEE